MLMLIIYQFVLLLRRLKFKKKKKKKKNEGLILPSDQHADIDLSDTFIIAIENTCSPEKENFKPHHSKKVNNVHLSWSKI